MATYEELYGIYTTGTKQELSRKIEVAIAIKAQDLISGTTPTAEQLTWAHNALKQTSQVAEDMLKYVLAANNTATVAQIEAATDAAIQSNVDEAADALIAGGLV